MASTSKVVTRLGMVEVLWRGGGKSIERSDIWYTKSIIGSPPKIFETVDAEVIQCVGCEPLPVINPNKQLIVKHSIVHLIGV